MAALQLVPRGVGEGGSAPHVPQWGEGWGGSPGEGHRLRPRDAAFLKCKLKRHVTSRLPPGAKNNWL